MPRNKKIYELTKKGMVSRINKLKKKNYIKYFNKTSALHAEFFFIKTRGLTSDFPDYSFAGRVSDTKNDLKILSDLKSDESDDSSTGQLLDSDNNNNICENNDRDVKFDSDSNNYYKNTEYFINPQLNVDKKSEVCANFLKKWTVENNITRSNVNYLLQFLNQMLPDLPLNYKTLLKTPRKSEIIEIPPGQYIHIGITQSLLHFLQKTNKRFKVLTVDVDVDGLPIFENCKEKGFWVILGRIQEIDKSVFPIGVYRGEKKPGDFKKFLRPYVNEMLTLIEDFQYNNEKIIVKPGLYPMDNPARAACCGVIQYNGYNSCPRCVIPGKSISKTMTFFGFGFESRTDRDFRDKIHPSFHKDDYSALESLPIDMVNDMLLDPLHAAYLGVMKRLLKIWFADNFHYFPHFMRALVSEKMLKLNEFLPFEFHREIRKIEEFTHFKGTEFRNFILRYGVFVLKDSIPQKEYQHFLLLHVAITILGERDLMIKRNNIAQQLLRRFVEGVCDLYGERNVVSNFHYILHLPEQAIYTGKTLDEYSTFEFENYMSPIKEYVQGNKHPLQQIHRRVQETFNANNLESVKLENHCVWRRNSKNPNQFDQVFYKGYKIDLSKKNRYILSEKCVFKIETIFYNENAITLSVRKALKHGDFYDIPIKSSKLNIYLCENKWSETSLHNIDKFERKMFAIELNKDYILFFPLSKFGEKEF